MTGESDWALVAARSITVRVSGVSPGAMNCMSWRNLSTSSWTTIGVPTGRESKARRLAAKYDCSFNATTTKLGSLPQLFQPGSTVVKKATTRPSPNFRSTTSGMLFRNDAATWTFESGSGFQFSGGRRYCSTVISRMN